MNSEHHPLLPFVPANARVLLLGSFPPPRRRWSMEFFYPNLQNDMWRVVGYLAAGDKTYFLQADGKAFDQPRIEAFCNEKGVAIYDTAIEVIRLKDNASDDFLQVVNQVDLQALLAAAPHLRHIVATGQKAASTLCAMVGCKEPAVGASISAEYAQRQLTIWRMPSTSRAYPRPAEWKAEFYRRVFVAAGVLK